ncbi:MAG: efflux RND transporter periplasmic adaptor subunit, partial [Cyanobacteria bacterium P01_A01_bin.17]
MFTANSAPTAESSAEASPPKSVETMALTPGTGNRQIRLLGQVEAGERATLSPQLDGTVQRVLVREGDRVTTGMTVAILDDADSRLALAEAQARLAQERSNLARLQVGTRPEVIAQREAEVDAARTRELEAQDNLQRIASLTAEGALAQRALIEARAEADAAKSERYRVEASLAEAQAGATKEEIDAQRGLVEAANAAVAQTRLRVQRTEIKAVSSGIVQSRDVDPGDYVEVSDPVVTIVRDRSLDIFLEVPESLSGQVDPGMRVTLSARALSDWRQETKITAVVPTANTTSRRQRVRVSLDNPPPRLLPGMAIQANLAVPAGGTDTFVVPRDALTRRGNEWLLFVVDNNLAQQLEVEIFADLGQEVKIANPELREGQNIVVTGGNSLT